MKLISRIQPTDGRQWICRLTQHGSRQPAVIIIIKAARQRRSSHKSHNKRPPCLAVIHREAVTFLRAAPVGGVTAVSRRAASKATSATSRVSCRVESRLE